MSDDTSSSLVLPSVFAGCTYHERMWSRQTEILFLMSVMASPPHLTLDYELPIWDFEAPDLHQQSQALWQSRITLTWWRKFSSMLIFHCTMYLQCLVCPSSLLPFLLYLELCFLFIWTGVIQRPQRAVNPAGQKQTEIGKHSFPQHKVVLEPAVWFLWFFQFPGWVVHKKGPRAADCFYSNSHSEVLGNRL